MLDQIKSKLIDYHQRYEAYLPATFFAGGFVLDIFTLGEIHDLSNIIIFFFYLTLSVFILAYEFEPITFRYRWVNKVLEYREDIFHFCLGALLSAFTLFYFKSSSLASSFIFMLVMMALLLLNETSLFQKNGILIRSLLFMLALVSYLLLVIPTLIGSSNILIFFLCILLAGALAYLFFHMISKKIKDKRKPLREILFPQFLVLILFVALYMLKILPPVPLSVKYMGIFHELSKSQNEYHVQTENPSWKFWNNGDQVFKARPGDKVYVLAKIFSPAGFSGKVYIRWLKKLPQGWTTSDRIPLKISGGRLAGFRGYTYKSNYSPGQWQVRVETEEELEIGRINLEIIEDPSEDFRVFRDLVIK